MSFNTLRRTSAIALILFASLSTPGCFLQIISGATFQVGNDLITTVETDSILATCVQGGNTSANVQCTYFFNDENGVPVSVISSAELISEFGILGVVIDPLIYQIPDTATNVTGTYSGDNGSSGDLTILSGYRSIPIDTYRTLIAEPDTQFVIAELPETVPFEDVQFSFSLSFMQSESVVSPVVVKPMLAAKYSTDQQVFYPPLMPCVDTMADVPAYNIEQASTLQPLDISPSATGCSGEQYLLLGFGVFACDFDGDDDVDRDDIALQASVRNSPALPGDRLDADGNGFIDLNDARRCAQQCLNPRCASSTGDEAGIGIVLPDVTATKP